MLRKRLCIFYYHGAGNEAIARQDYEQFYEKIKNQIDANKDLSIGYALCPDVGVLLDELDKLMDPAAKWDELYLHFSGHGAMVGIPYKDWVLENANFTALLKHPKIKFCFFSSCQSADLASMVSNAKIPVVLGTAGANDIQNDYAIHFQNIFYTKLLQSFTFKDAYQAAVSHANQHQAKNFHPDIIIRREGGGDFAGETEINDLKLYVTSEAENDRFMIPRDWVMKMNQVGHAKPWCLNWFDDIAARDLFYTKLEGEGLQEILSWEDLPTPELYLLKDRGGNTDDPFMNTDINILLHCSKEELLPEELRLYLQKLKSSAVKNIKVIFCLKDSLDVNVLFGDVKVLEAHPHLLKFAYSDVSASLITDGPFIAALDKIEIQSAERKRITLDFDSKPFKAELYEIDDDQKFVRIYFAKNINERLVNFLANWIKYRKILGMISFVADNQHNPQVNLLEDLEKQLQVHFNNDRKLAPQIRRLYDMGCIVILRNRSNDPNSGIEIVQGLLTHLDHAAKMYELEGEFYGKAADRPLSLFFILNEGDFKEPASPHHRIWLKTFSTPMPVDTLMIQSWADKYSPTSSNLDIVVKKVKEISKNLKPQDDPKVCPSVVIESICTQFKIPQKNILII